MALYPCHVDDRYFFIFVNVSQRGGDIVELRHLSVIVLDERGVGDFHFVVQVGVAEDVCDVMEIRGNAQTVFIQIGDFRSGGDAERPAGAEGILELDRRDVIYAVVVSQIDRRRQLIRLKKDIVPDVLGIGLKSLSPTDARALSDLSD